jgi:acetolactate synthase-1/2/3 large subunit
MTRDSKLADPHRRCFLKSAAIAGIAPAIPVGPPGAQAQGLEPRQVPSARSPSDKTMAAEVRIPQDINRIGGTPGSDFMVDVIKMIDIKYAPSNCSSSYRGLHESIINYGKNRSPEFISCMHEECAVGMAHGYFKASGKPLMTMVAGGVGLQHASMAIFNAFCDRVPVIVMSGNESDGASRPSGVNTLQSSQDSNLIIRDFTKWDDAPVSLQHFALSMVQGHKIAMTPPYGPVAISIDAGLQQEPIGARSAGLSIPKISIPTPPAGEMGAVREAARLLVNAESPVIIVDRSARTPHGIPLLVQLAELLQAQVVDQGSRMNFPNTHYLSRPGGVISAADVILALELTDDWGTVNAWTDDGAHGVGTNSPRIKPGVKLISINSNELLGKSNYQGLQRYQPADISMPADAEATLPALIEAVKSQLTPERSRAIEGRADRAKRAFTEIRNRERTAAAVAWDASPISTARLCMELYGQIKDLDWSLISSEGWFVSNWPNRLWPMDKHHHWLGRSGGYGLGYGATAAVGAAMANRDLGRFSVSIQTDGDLMYSPSALWTAAKHKIPMLCVMHNNRAWHQESMHLQKMASFRNRESNYGDDDAPIGTSIMNPDIEYHKLAESMGWWAKGPIRDPEQLGPALKEAIAVVKSGQPALLNTWTQPR